MVIFTHARHPDEISNRCDLNHFFTNPNGVGSYCLNFNELNLDDRILAALTQSGFREPTPIQQKAIPVILAGEDLMASAQTGTGKTAAFVLPLLQRLLRPSPRSGQGPRVLVLTPTRELAIQVTENIKQFSRTSKVTTGAIVGGMGYGPQLRMLRGRIDVLVATPGRLTDLMQQGKVNFSRLEMLVLDEADRMLDMGFIDAVKKIAAALPAKKQTLLFSATLEGTVLKIANQLLSNPKRIALAANREQHKSIAQLMHHIDGKEHKHRILDHLMTGGELTKTLIFTATKRGADQLAKGLRSKNFKAGALHGDMSQSKRRQMVENLRTGRIEMLVATDVAARGLDIKHISHVINFDLPMVAEDYIHRIGRTGRADAVGRAISLVSAADWKKLSNIEKLTGHKIKREVIKGLEPKSAEADSKATADQAMERRRGFSKRAKTAAAKKPGSWRRGSGKSKNAKSNQIRQAA